MMHHLLRATLVVTALVVSVAARQVGSLSREITEEYRLDPAFYKKATEVSDILIATSERVSDATHREAAYLFAKIAFPGRSPELLKRCLDGGDILVNGEATHAGVAVTGKDEVLIMFGGDKQCYAAKNRAEYFAEGVQAWFDTNRTMDHDHNHIHTREQLKQYDPGLSAADKRPNILFIFTDDHSANAIGAYNRWLKSVNPTPQIDRLASQGMVFERSYCTNSICEPVRAVIETGKHSHLNGFRQNGERFNWDQPTFPKVLRETGYQTILEQKKAVRPGG